MIHHIKVTKTQKHQSCLIKVIYDLTAALKAGIWYSDVLWPDTYTQYEKYVGKSPLMLWYSTVQSKNAQ